MSELQEIDVFLLSDGTTRIEIRGIKGPRCLDVIHRVETLLGGEVVGRDCTDEFYQRAEGTSQQVVDRRDEA